MTHVLGSCRLLVLSSFNPISWLINKYEAEVFPPKSIRLPEIFVSNHSPAALDFNMLDNKQKEKHQKNRVSTGRLSPQAFSKSA
jgi:hypothetical protein